MGTELPYIDEHSMRIPAGRATVWKALQDYAATSLRIPAGNPLARLLGTRPAAGFEVSETTPLESLALVGRHRFSRYLLRFELADAPGGATLLQAQSYANFPGLHGLVYRALVIGSRAHVVATHHILRGVRRRSLR
jgi:hypothetical protein